MKRIVLTFGLISGAILSVTMVLAIVFFKDAIGDRGEIVGYSSMVLAFLLVFFGVRAYRENVAGGTIGFGRAFKVGALIAAVASLCYVATWEVIYYGFMPDYMAKYAAQQVEKIRASGAPPQQVAAKEAQMKRFARLYRNPLINAGITFLEPLPVALVMALVSAGVLSRGSRRRQREPGPGVTAGALV